MKKIRSRYLIIIAVVLSLALLLSACGGTAEKPSETQAQQETAGAEIQQEIAETEIQQEIAETEAQQDDSSDQAQSDQKEGEDTAEAESQSEEAQADNIDQEDNDQTDGGNGTGVLYFSRMGNTDFTPDVDVAASASLVYSEDELKGNAQLMAEWIADEVGCPVSAIIQTDKYPESYDETINIAREEQRAGARPELSSDPGLIDSYDTVYLVLPNWWGDLPMALYTFFDEADFSGKTINVFVTHGGSGFSRMIDTIKELEPDAVVNEGVSVYYSSVPDSEQEIRQWVKDNLGV